jgi:hypothetical protein
MPITNSSELFYRSYYFCLYCSGTLVPLIWTLLSRMLGTWEVLHLTLSLMNRLNQTEFAIFTKFFCHCTHWYSFPKTFKLRTCSIHFITFVTCLLHLNKQVLNIFLYGVNEKCFSEHLIHRTMKMFTLLAIWTYHQYLRSI